MKNLYSPFHMGMSCSLDRNIWGSKGSRLSDMIVKGVNIPPGFIASMPLCSAWIKGLCSLDEQKEIMKAHISDLELSTGRRFPRDNPLSALPLLVSVRSGSSISMPGMMDTVLNIGMTKDSIPSLQDFFKNRKFPLDLYRRFLCSYASVVYNCKDSIFHAIVDDYKRKQNIKDDYHLSESSLECIISEYEEMIRDTTDGIPQDPYDQVFQCVQSIFRSWNSKRARYYRDVYKIDHDLGTAAIIQMMVFGNKNKSSGTGVVFTCDPADGDNLLCGEFLLCAQGEDVVSGIRTPHPVSIEMKTKYSYGDFSMEDILPQSYEILRKQVDLIEDMYAVPQDIEFTVEDGHVWILQSRNVQLGPQQFFRFVADCIKEKKVPLHNSVLSCLASIDVNKILHSSLEAKVKESARLIAGGLPASPGVAVGVVVFDTAEAIERSNQGEKIILVRNDTTPEDVQAMGVCQGVVTARGGLTSHAAVVARNMGKPCICGTNIVIRDDLSFTSGDCEVKKGDKVTIDGHNGGLYSGYLEINVPGVSDDLKHILQYSKDIIRWSVLANADIADDVSLAYNLGADGVGLCRTEHMFFSDKRICFLQQVLLRDEKNTENSLKKLQDFQRDDFVSIFEHTQNDRCSIRLLDPPMHEFLPSSTVNFEELSSIMGVSVENLVDRVKLLKSKESMLGLRGARLGVLYPDVYRSQMYAIIKAQHIFYQKHGFKNKVGVMIPFVSTLEEVSFFYEMFQSCIRCYERLESFKAECSFGVMIEVPRFAYIAHECTDICDFFSFGTNDLTQMMWGISRDDSSFLTQYFEENLVKNNPFDTLDLITIALTKKTAQAIRSARADAHICLCGENIVSPNSLSALKDIDCIDAFSCSPYRIPSVRIVLSSFCPFD